VFWGISELERERALTILPQSKVGEAGSAVGIAASHRRDDLGLGPGRGVLFFSSPKQPIPAVEPI
jgi:hypothetical protein